MIERELHSGEIDIMEQAVNDKLIEEIETHPYEWLSKNPDAVNRYLAIIESTLKACKLQTDEYVDNQNKLV